MACDRFGAKPSPNYNPTYRQWDSSDKIQTLLIGKRFCNTVCKLSAICRAAVSQSASHICAFIYIIPVKPRRCFKTLGELQKYPKNKFSLTSHLTDGNNISHSLVYFLLVIRCGSASTMRRRLIIYKTHQTAVALISTHHPPVSSRGVVVGAQARLTV